MTDNSSELTSINSFAFYSLSLKYCTAVENAADTTVDDFVDEMIRLLPRLYISACELPTDDFAVGEYYSSQSLTEDVYDSVRDKIAALMGEDDTYLEVFEEDMKYSDTPIAASVSEGLADLYQVFYDLNESTVDAPADIREQALVGVRESFAEYWSRTLTNVLRALNAIKFR